MKICVLPGDGIGPEITAQAVRVLNSLDLKFVMEEALHGGGADDATGNTYPEATQKLTRVAKSGARMIASRTKSRHPRLRA